MSGYPPGVPALPRTYHSAEVAASSRLDGFQSRWRPKTIRNARAASIVEMMNSPLRILVGESPEGFWLDMKSHVQSFNHEPRRLSWKAGRTFKGLTGGTSRGPTHRPSRCGAECTCSIIGKNFKAAISYPVPLVDDFHHFK